MLRHPALRRPAPHLRRDRRPAGEAPASPLDFDTAQPSQTEHVEDTAHGQLQIPHVNPGAESDA